ncbi:MAG TPA: FAD:protein FMN transferase, partial [Longimicrobiales bacterium]
RRGGERVVFFHSRDVALDLGGIGKGWAVDRAVDALRAHGIRDAVVNAGGDLYAMGYSERGDAWEIGVQSPTDPHATVATFKLTDAAVATSGDYVRFFDYHGRRYSHLMDPHTGAPRVTREHSVSVRAATCIDADAGATAVFGCEPARAQQMLASAAPGARLIHSI